MIAYPKVSFGIIVLNGEPFTRYCLRSLYPYAHEIIVAEGAVQGARAIATRDGHSIDGTLETLRRFKEEEDPEDKVRLIVRDGFWEEKDQQSQAYAGMATGDWLWQVDIDEFYQPRDMEFILDLLATEPYVTAASFEQKTFFGSPDYVCDSTYLEWGAKYYHRLFRWEPGFAYATHRPPTVVDRAGTNLRDVNPLDPKALAAAGVHLYHYSLLFPKQVREKVVYYGTWNVRTHKDMPNWAQEQYFRFSNPFNLHNVNDHPGWAVPYGGSHPPQALAMWEDALAGNLGVDLRPMDDVKRLADSPWYRRGQLAVHQELLRRPGKHLRMDDPVLRFVVNPGAAPRLRLALVNADAGGGGVDRAVSNLCRELTGMACDVRAYARTCENEPAWLERLYLDKLDGAAGRADLPRDHGLASCFLLPRKGPFVKSDVLHLHGLFGGCLNPLAIPLLSALKPCVWTMPDMEALIGSGAFPEDGEAWPVEDPNAPPAPDAVKLLRKHLTLVARSADATIVTASRWLQERIAQSAFKDAPCETIPPAVDTDVFRPLPKGEARRLLQLPQDALVLAFSAKNGLENREKGGDLLKAALEALRRMGLNVTLIATDCATGTNPPGVLAFPAIADPNLLAVIYAAADAFAYPARAESRPLPLLEAMACGLPAACSRAGGLPEFVKEGETGLLSPAGDLDALTRNLRILLEKPVVRETFGKNAARAAKRFSAARIAERHLALYERTIADRASRAGKERQDGEPIFAYFKTILNACGNAPGAQAYEDLLSGRLQAAQRLYAAASMDAENRGEP